jgi:hypothetical protein
MSDNLTPRPKVGVTITLHELNTGSFSLFLEYYHRIRVRGRSAVIMVLHGKCTSTACAYKDAPPGSILVSFDYENGEPGQELLPGDTPVELF